ncbi:fatty acid CoA ligase family protein [Rubinisphaera margarita]|uniref:fatty acid CoA ligase family protein n=1 Tax=Rubinisphaera margarita TaxID=2909586 RepID=UPI001EE94FBB|nr:fatty acid CoA ligase family protein [Rubinisphaera margarita]MCG6156272.1 AMP-binding protein [Rubinisphaera margarita]
MTDRLCNIADRLRTAAGKWPHQRCVVFPESRDRRGRVAYTHLTFAQLDQETSDLAAGLQQLGVSQEHKLVLMVRPGIEFIALTFAVFKTGATVVLIDPGMGRKRIFDCLDEIEPDGFIALPIIHAIRRLRRGRYPRARFNVSVGTKREWGGIPYLELLEQGRNRFRPVETKATDRAAIIFTSGSTGPPKGVVYEHGMFDAQVDLLQQQYRIQPGEIDLPGFPLFALFNLAMGVTTVIPDMDPTRPADVNPLRIIEAIENQGITQTYGSPALWNRVGRYCVEKNIQLPSLKRMLSAGAPVPVHVLQKMTQSCAESDAEMFTPYGATEALPVCSISASQVLNETAALTAQGRGTCVGTPFPHVDVAVIEPQPGPIANFADAVGCAPGTIGEIVVSSPSATREYYERPEATAQAKIPDGDRFWHRMGDMGYFDDEGRLWFCGRKAHIVTPATGPMYPVCCEPIFNQHDRIYRTALVGIGPAGQQEPVLIAEPEAGQFPNNATSRQRLLQELRELGRANPLTESITKFLFHRSLPVDRRHNVKIHREELAVWATSQKLLSAGEPRGVDR